MELLKLKRSNDHAAISRLYEEIKKIPKEVVQQMPEVVYARYLRLLAKAENHAQK
ncbi:MAG: hypothetical protein HOP08_04745 [Cyclobacteriaceae bacterium]|nr:hypothetical protein [Cyclobacteriaceae bacterium]